MPRKTTSTKIGALEQSSTDTEKYVGAKIWIHKFESTIKQKIIFLNVKESSKNDK